MPLYCEDCASGLLVASHATHAAPGRDEILRAIRADGTCWSGTLEAELEAIARQRKLTVAAQAASAPSTVKRASFGLPADGRARWCGECAKAHPGARNVVNSWSWSCEDGCLRPRKHIGNCRVPVAPDISTAVHQARGAADLAATYRCTAEEIVSQAEDTVRVATRDLFQKVLNELTKSLEALRPWRGLGALSDLAGSEAVIILPRRFCDPQAGTGTGTKQAQAGTARAAPSRHKHGHDLLRGRPRVEGGLA